MYAWMLCVFTVIMAYSITCPIIAPFGEWPGGGGRSGCAADQQPSLEPMPRSSPCRMVHACEAGLVSRMKHQWDGVRSRPGI